MSADEKQLLRRQCRHTRLALGEATHRQASQEICAHIARWTLFRQACSVLTYMPIKAEVDLRPLLEEFPGKAWVLPRIDESDHSMSFHAYDPLQLVKHVFGMQEPAAHLPLIAPGEIELALIPGLAYDRQGWRLGYGGGYFDRFLAGFKGASLGVTYQALLLEALPRGEYDLPVGWLVTEQGISKAGG
ncbi:MAG TPA: 5-formyltetrahydrofolate cyclo-ligase [Anaerolineales bacterium]|jgi:5-formyltetrahydrofolate cyclo-ligase